MHGSNTAHLLGAMAAPAIARRASFLVGREDETLLPASIRIIDDPLRPRGLHSRPFDGEGVACAPRVLVEDGKVTKLNIEDAPGKCDISGGQALLGQL